MPHTWFHLLVEPVDNPEDPGIDKLLGSAGDLSGIHIGVMREYSGWLRIQSMPGNPDGLMKLKRELGVEYPGLNFVVIGGSDYSVGTVQTDWEIELQALTDRNDIDALIDFLNHDHYGIGPDKPDLIHRLFDQAMGTDDVDVIDKVLINFKHFYANGSILDEMYFRLINRGVQMAVQYEAPSLTETVIYCLGTLANQYPQLIDLAHSLDDERVTNALNWLKHQ